jgi:hypothetical protein
MEEKRMQQDRFRTSWGFVEVGTLCAGKGSCWFLIETGTRWETWESE